MNGPGRPPSGALRMNTGRGGRMSLASSSGIGRQPPGTGMNPMTARPGTRGGAFGGALNSQIQVSDRPVTRQGLGGIKTQSQGPQRQVQDKSYWLGLLRGKVNELNSEIAKLTKEINDFNQENASYLSYEKRAENLAGEIKHLQGELSDYNTIVDKLNINAGFEDLEEDYSALKDQNDKEAQSIDDLFALKTEKEEGLRKLNVEINQEHKMTESLLADMPGNLREKYAKLKSMSLHLQEDLERKQNELDELNSKIDNIEEDISQSLVKQEAVKLYEKISELEEKQASLLDEMKKSETPAEERERLLKQVREDNQEIAHMENRANEMREKTEKIQDEIAQLDMDLEEHHGERKAKYKELKKRDEDMQEFLDSFEKNKRNSEERRKELQSNIVELLEKISRATVQSKHMPSANEYKQMQEDLDFKETEMTKSQDTTTSLDAEHAKLQSDLEKVEQLESKISDELNSLRSKIDRMNEELKTFVDLDTLRRDAEEKKEILLHDKEELQLSRQKLKQDVASLTKTYEEKKKSLEENETYVQLGNLERKWQHLEQNNFAIKDYIAQKTAETSYAPLKENVGGWVHEINQSLILSLNANLK